MLWRRRRTLIGPNATGAETRLSPYRLRTFGANVMRKIYLAEATTIILALAASNADAMCGGNLSPSRTPYAVLGPQTNVADIASPGAAARPVRAKLTTAPHS